MLFNCSPTNEEQCPYGQQCPHTHTDCRPFLMRMRLFSVKLHDGITVIRYYLRLRCRNCGQWGRSLVQVVPHFG